MSDPRILKLQEELHSIGGALGPADGWLEPDTRAAFERFLAETPEDLHIEGAYRTIEQQTAIWLAWQRQQNPSRARRFIRWMLEKLRCHR